MRKRFTIPLVAGGLAVGVSGLAWSAPRAATQAVVTCDATTACLNVSNTSTGAALIGTADAGSAVIGQTSGNASTAGVYGVASGGGTGVSGTSAVGYGVLGRSVKSNGVFASSTGVVPTILGSTVASTGVGVAGLAPRGIGISSIGLQAFKGIGQFATQGSGMLLTLTNSTDQVVFSVDQAGDLYTTAYEIFCGAAYNTNNGACDAEGEAPASRSREAQTALRVVRFGRATLSGGSARVALDPDVAAGVSSAHPYHVFLTGTGSASGWLYVAARTRLSFTVREHGAARSNETFGYRIVAESAPGTAAPAARPL